MKGCPAYILCTFAGMFYRDTFKYINKTNGELFFFFYIYVGMLDYMYQAVCME